MKQYTKDQLEKLVVEDCKRIKQQKGNMCRVWVVLWHLVISEGNVFLDIKFEIETFTIERNDPLLGIVYSSSTRHQEHSKILL